MLPERPLYLITDGGRLRLSGRLILVLLSLIEEVPELISCIQLREQIDNPREHLFAASDAEITELALVLREKAQAAGIRLILSGQPELAFKLKLDGAHLGIRHGRLSKIKKKWGGKMLLGFSAHNISQAAAAEKIGMDYAFLSPIFSPLSKPETRTPLGILPLTEAAATLKLPLFALGGITAENVGEIAASGVRGVALISSVMHAENPVRAARAIADNFYRDR